MLKELVHCLTASMKAMWTGVSVYMSFSLDVYVCVAPTFAGIVVVLYLYYTKMSMFITTEGTLRLPTTFDNHPIHPHIVVKMTSPLKI